MSLCEESLLPSRAPLFNLSFKLPDFGFMGLFPIGSFTPFFPKISFPEMEGEFRFSLLVTQFHGWILANIINVINDLDVIPINFNIPVLSLDIDIFKFFSNDANYIAGLKKSIINSIDVFYDLIPNPFKFWGGEFSSEFPEFKFINVWNYISRMLNSGMFVILYDAIKSIIKYIEDLFVISGPSLPIISMPDIDTMILDIMNQDIDIWEKIKALLNIELFGFNFDAIMGGKIEERFEMPERLLQRIIETLKNFSIEFPKNILFSAINSIMGFLSLLPGIGTITEFLTMTFCTFLKTVVGFDPDFVANGNSI